MHVIAAKAVAFQEALQPSFRFMRVPWSRMAKALAESLMSRGFDLVTGGNR